ncbi:MAG: sulfate transporter CysZ [Cellvibrio sp. 79]|nr:MAG: sulfate transporter CysZ [Cellvibrio sp. 79]
MQGSIRGALHYFFDGAKLIATPGFRRFILIPLFINLLIFGAVTVLLIHAFSDFFTQILQLTPDWLDWLTWLLWPLIAFIFLVVYGYSFNIITNFIAAPFFGLLAEKVEAHATGKSLPEEPWGQLIPRTLKRETIKLGYFLSRGILVLVVFIALFFIPGLNFLGMIIATLWSCWCMAIQYTDYAADNHQFNFRALRHRLRQQQLTSFSYGGLILLGSMIPLLNIFVPPIAVAGATLYWVRELNNGHNAS